ncbi:Rdi1 protein [Martiniozyma asiatica (nom. inval.)]|nr:Rdi1 protein [Martiniozyma asiatica]
MTDDFDLQPEEVPGFKVGAKRTVDEYAKLDANDESLNKWKRSLGLNTGNPLSVIPGDERKVVILSMTLTIQGENPVVVDLSNANDYDALKAKKIHFKIKEKSIYQLTVKFKVQHEIITGLKYLQGVKKAAITVDKLEEPMGSFAPNTEDKQFYEKVFDEVEAPSGFIARGSYSAVSKFIDDDKVTHLIVPWSFQITK